MQKNCTFEGAVVVYGNATFINCTFQVTEPKHYALFIDHEFTGGGSDTVTLENCTFTADGSYGCIKVADDCGDAQTLNMKDCTINHTNTHKGVAVNLGSHSTLNLDGTNLNNGTAVATVADLTTK